MLMTYATRIRGFFDIAILPRYHSQFVAMLFQWSHAHCQHFCEFTDIVILSLYYPFNHVIFVQFCVATGVNCCMFHHLYDSAGV